MFRTPVVLDGSMGTQLIEGQCDYVDKNPLWSAAALLQNPEIVKRVHKEYLKSGATIIETNTYQASVINLKKYANLSREDAERTVKQACQLAKLAIAEYCLEHALPTSEYMTFGSIGPYATVLHDCSEYKGDYVSQVHADAIKNYYTDQYSCFLNVDVDSILLETVPSLQEALLALEVFTQHPSKPICISFSCRDSISTCKGDDFAQVVNQLCRYKGLLSAIGINCTDRCNILSLLQRGLQSSLPFMVYPNGQVGNNHYLAPIGSYAKDWIQFGAKVIGGCCFTKPSDIKTIADSLLETNVLSR